MWPFKLRQKAATSQPSLFGGWGRFTGDFFPGAWQQNQSLSRDDLTRYPAVFACISRIADDVAGLPWSVVSAGEDGVVRGLSPLLSPPSLARPNSWQTPAQFRRAWIVSKLTYGNAAVLLNGSEMYVLDWSRIVPEVTTEGAIYYRLSVSTPDLLPSTFRGSIPIPASQIIHDRGVCLQNQLVGVPPLAAAYLPAAKNQRILQNTTDLVANGNQLGGLLSVPAGMSDEDATKLREYWKSTSPRDVRVLGMDAKFTGFSMTSEQAELAQQLQLSDRQIASAFGLPPYLIGASDYPSGLKPSELLQLYFKTTLSGYVSSMEELLTSRLDLPQGARVKLDTDELLSLDPVTKGTVYTGLLKGGILTTNEARSRFGLAPVAGGNEILTQMQNQPLSGAAAP